MLPQEVVRSRMHQLNAAMLFYALDKLKTNMENTSNYTNSTKYLISCIYNSINEYKNDAELQFGIESG